MRRTLLAAPLLLAAVAAPRAARADACSPPTVMVVLDKSSSMRTGTIGGATKWSIAVDALDTVLTGVESQAEVGLMTFPQPSRCSPGALDVAPGLDNRAEILGALGSPPPTAGNYTPMAQTLEAAAVEPTLVGVDAPRYVVLISDGWQWCDPYDPATRFDGVDAVASLNVAGVTTFVVGFGGATDAAALNLMAVEAGTARPGCNPANDAPSDPNQCYFQADSADELIAALEAIVDVVVEETCDGLDNDCDGEVDEDLVRDCATACGAGAEACVDGVWEGCDAPAPGAETCNGADDDCDGTVDPGCDCVAGEVRPCGETSDEGACHPGTQTCGADGTWGACDESVGPAPEMCDGVDNDCDGVTDEPDANGGDDVGDPLCAPGEACVDGDCQPIEPVDPPVDEVTGEEGSPAGCGCSSQGSAGGALLLLPMAFLLFRRRRDPR